MSFDLLLKIVFFCCLVFWLFGLVNVLLFVVVEYKEKDDKEEKI